ncbi:Remorin family protein [Trifolium repens]|nr:Remorin family protein [Trifolium repens]
MDNWIKQLREKLLIGAEEENKADFGGSRDQKIPIQKTSSFKDKKKAHNWFQRQTSRKMSHGDYDSIGMDSIEMEHATAVAAAAFAISSHVPEISHEKKMSEFSETSLTKSRSKKVNDKNSSFSQIGAASKRLSGSFKITDDKGNNLATTSPIREEKMPKKTISFPPAPSMKKTPTFGEKSKRTNDKKPDIPKRKNTPSFADEHFFDADDTQHETPKQKILPQVDDPIMSSRPPPPPPPPPAPEPPISQTSKTSLRPPTRQSTIETKADSWEREELKKIKDRYEKLLETIDSWEKRKKMKARRKLNKYEQSENEQKREKARKKYQDKMKYIDEIAVGARAQSDERRKNETLKAQEKAERIRTTGKLPGACSCF